MTLKIPDAPSTYTTDFSNLNGADFSVDPSLVDKSRSPDLLNMISNDGSFPRKRKGWEVLSSAQTDEIDNIWTFELYGETRCVVAVGTKIIEFNLSTNTYIGTGTTTTAGKKGAFFYQNSDTKGLYILNNTNLILATAVSSTAPLTFTEPSFYIPTLTISRIPATGESTFYESVNRMTRTVKEQFIDTAGTAVKFFCSLPVTSVVKFEYLDANATWQTDTTATASGNYITITSAHSYNAPKGEDNIRITYVASGATTASRVCGCKSVGHMTQGVADQVFLAANSDYPQHVYYCGLSDPTYVPDTNYLLIGSGGTQIMGFLNLQGYLAVVKESSGQDPTVFLLSSTQTSTTPVEYIYKVEQGISGIGALSKWSFRTLTDEPMFLSPNGISGIITETLTSEKITRNRSRYIDAKLLDEDNLENAVAEVWNNYYILVVNSHAYVLDGRQKTNDANGNTSYLYEAYYWDNIPATCMRATNNNLYFGTSDGRICRFKTRKSDDTLYIYDFSDGSIGSPVDSGYTQGDAIHAIWSTPNYDDGAPQMLKTMLKRGSMLTMQPYARSGATVSYSADSNPVKTIGSIDVDIFEGFASIDFTRFAFDTRPGARDYFFGKKIKDYKRLKIIVENDRIIEPFGIHEIIRTYTKNKYAKK
jgi:hypothetical protein